MQNTFDVILGCPFILQVSQYDCRQPRADGRSSTGVLSNGLEILNLTNVILSNPSFCQSQHKTNLPTLSIVGFCVTLIDPFFFCYIGAASWCSNQSKTVIVAKFGASWNFSIRLPDSTCAWLAQLKKVSWSIFNVWSTPQTYADKFKKTSYRFSGSYAECDADRKSVV